MRNTMPQKIFAVIDLGTNTTKCTIAAHEYDTLDIRAEYIEYNRLGAGLLPKSLLSPSAMLRTLKALESISKKARSYSVEKLWMVGTMALRTAQNSNELIDLITAQTDMSVEILDAQTEALYSYRAAQQVFGSPVENLLAFDIGGGSTELIVAEAGKAPEAQSIGLGIVTLTESYKAYDAIDETILKTMTGHALASLSSHLPITIAEPVIGMGGSVLALRDLLQANTNLSQKQGNVITRKTLENTIILLSKMSLVDRRGLPGMDPLRADVIIAGLIIIHSIITLQDADRFFVGPWGMRHGLLLNRTGAHNLIRR